MCTSYDKAKALLRHSDWFSFGANDTSKNGVYEKDIQICCPDYEGGLTMHTEHLLV